MTFDKVPPSVRLPEPVTVPVRVRPLTLPVPPTLVTVPVVELVPAPIAVLKSDAERDETVLSELKRGKVIALGLAMVNTLAPSVVAPRAVRAVAAVLDPVPPFAIATIPVTFADVPEVFWFNVGKSAATAIDGTPVPVVFLRIPVPNEDINVPLIFVTVAVRTPVLLAAVTSPVIEMV